MPCFVLLQAAAVLLTAVPQGKELPLIALAQHTHCIYCLIALKMIIDVVCFPGDLYAHF